jgi:putative CocE/NonD family hydrolase
MAMLEVAERGAYWAGKGYVFVVQDVRGRGDSEGTFDFFFQEEKDGFDTIEWLARQPFSNGRVAMMGVSYLGTVQWLAAKAHPPALKCIAPTAPAGRYLEELPFVGGAFMHQWALSWINGVSGRMDQGANAAGVDWDEVLAHRPLLSADSVMGREMRLYNEFLANPLMTDYWKRIQFSDDDFRRIDIPTLTVTGWFDGDQPGALGYWRGLEAHAPDKAKHFLVAGPWDHGQTFLGGATRIGDMTLSPESVIDNAALHLAFFDWCLKQSSPRFDQPRVKVYVTGANVWREFESYSPSAVEMRSLYLSSGGRANSLAGDGKLTWNEPAAEPPDRFTYDPKHPVPSSLGGASYAYDRRPIERRDDVLVFTSEVLTDPVEVIGNIQVLLQAASDARDTDFTAAITDVYPDGRSVILGPTVGIRRGRYRNGPAREELLTPGKVETFPIELYDIAHRFEPGHRIRIEISSSSAPHFNPNQNTGNPVATDTEWRVARQTVYHDRGRPSSIRLPVLSRTLVP